jgi:N-lysine methyltransferase SETD6
MVLFSEEHPKPDYSLKVYHITGSYILSRSFQVESLLTTDSVDSSQTPAQEDAEMSLDELSLYTLNDNSSDESKDDDNSDNNDDAANVAMVPLANMLNVWYGCKNVHVYHT